MVETDVDDILALKGEGLSYSAIGEWHGLTRNQVAGVLFRVRASGQAIPQPATSPPKPQPQRPARKRPAPAGKAVRPEKPVAAPLVEAVTPPPVGAGEAILALKPNQCRWAFGDARDADFRFCCAPVFGLRPTDRSGSVRGSFCRAHVLRALDPAYARRIEAAHG